LDKCTDICMFVCYYSVLNKLPPCTFLQYFFSYTFTYAVLCKSDTLRKIISRIEAGDMMVQELCEFGDKLLTDETAKVFKKEKDMKKGTAWQPCKVANC